MRWVLLLTATGCAPAQEQVRTPSPTPPASAAPAPVPVPRPVVADAGSNAGSAASQAPACPRGMAHVAKDFCPRVERRCLKTEYDKANHITLCHHFERGVTRCLEPRVALDFCIDEYEYPNQPGAHPPWMVDWHEATSQCEAKGKRLCYESEWTAACEGPDETPFPYGWDRDPTKCNIDNAWVTPSLGAMYSRDPAVSEPELRRLDRSVPSGSRPGCVSGYGVFDLTGNLDEWTHADHDRPKEKGRLAALKGGAWGHVRNACRPVTTSHEPEFRYYFVSFRCCADLQRR